ncbi:hypothetical protein BKA70DRAFT_849595 [Coprinopsis sp. MPI-PUGE-AT-0042]|nr:hypothetical protein BKA70DRAFT_849595 [Coprinopsis sp. MPI-PUGE-AT-0042]
MTSRLCVNQRFLCVLALPGLGMGYYGMVVVHSSKLSPTRVDQSFQRRNRLGAGLSTYIICLSHVPLCMVLTIQQ